MPSFVATDTSKKISNFKPIQNNRNILPPSNTLSNINNPFSKKLGGLPFNIQNNGTQEKKEEFKLPVPGEGLPRVIHYCADQSGCGFWRMIWPADELLSQNKAVVMTLYQMVPMPLFYNGITAVRLQRQCTETQLEFVKFLRSTSDTLKQNTGKGFRIIWEVDDICGPPEAIPDYNVCKTAFTDNKIGDIIKNMLSYCDEMCVVSDVMRQHYKDYLGYDKITVIPNYAPKYWLDKGYDEYQLIANFRKHKRKPRVLYAGSATHFDLLNKANQQDDFGHVIHDIINDITIFHKYEWIFMGGVPATLRQYIGKGIELHDWTEITNYPDKLRELNATLMIAPLANNVFSRAKANIKLIEAGALGIPMIAQNLECYNSDGWEYLFDDSKELFTKMYQVTSSEGNYRRACAKSRAYAERFWLKDHVDEWNLLYTTEYGSPERAKNESFLRNNPTQFN